MVQENDPESIPFTWGKRGGRGGKNKDVQFYESFTFDDVFYTLYDSVYLYKDGEEEPYIGKIVKIWEAPKSLKRVKILWFFRPREITNHLGSAEVAADELFLASGVGKGLANINPLGAIAGKCTVVCTSKDSRNPQPSEEELQIADFFFYRTFDVDKCMILDKLDDKIAGIEVKFLLNRVDKKLEVDQVHTEKRAKVLKDPGELNDRPSKKVKLDGSAKVFDDGIKKTMQKLSPDSRASDAKVIFRAPSVIDDQSGSKLLKDPEQRGNGPPKKLKLDDKIAKISNSKLSQPSEKLSALDGGSAICNQPTIVSSRPKAPWKEEIQTGHEDGTLVLLQNLDPSSTSAEVEDIVWSAFRENCRAKMIRQTAFSNPHFGQALVIFKTREAAEKAVKKLNDIVLLSNERPLVGRFVAPALPKKQTTFFGHLFIDRHRVMREMKEAVSTSHCSQPNTIEYEMALEWQLRQERSYRIWRTLREEQGEELRKFKDVLKPK
ncbi:hypothetical protein Tsubulata_030501 [Turnera subulata]|uniref:BAH domain-containing protein n=1 Tax=Turnera subulata TaxID=218843 RepID=A0A9Q0G6G0_9ROSI|nr:hypothetical protein Tsubulata_030501 [Turnera subulata]